MTEKLSKETRMDIAKRLKAIRSSKNITQEKMSELLDISYGTYVKIENGRQNLTIKRLLDICSVLNVTSDAIIHGDIDKTKTFNFDEFLLLCDIFSKERLDETQLIIEKMIKLKEFKDNSR